MPTINTAIPIPTRPSSLRLIFSETLIGALIGLIGRLFYHGAAVHGDRGRPACGLQSRGRRADRGRRAASRAGDVHHVDGDRLLFVTDQHWEVLRALLASYSVIPINEPVAPALGLARLADAFSSTFILALQISSPFIVYALIINLMVGIANKLVPQIPVYFISMPFVLAGGLLLLYFTIGEALRLFMAAFVAWLTTG